MYIYIYYVCNILYTYMHIPCVVVAVPSHTRYWRRALASSRQRRCPPGRSSGRSTEASRRSSTWGGPQALHPTRTYLAQALRTSSKLASRWLGVSIVSVWGPKQKQGHRGCWVAFRDASFLKPCMPCMPYYLNVWSNLPNPAAACSKEWHDPSVVEGISPDCESSHNDIPWEVKQGPRKLKNLAMSSRRRKMPMARETGIPGTWGLICFKPSEFDNILTVSTKHKDKAPDLPVSLACLTSESGATSAVWCFNSFRLVQETPFFDFVPGRTWTGVSECLCQDCTWKWYGPSCWKKDGDEPSQKNKAWIQPCRRGMHQ